MPSDPRRRQKKLERRNARRKEKKHAIVRQQSAGIGERLAAAAKFPVLHCCIGNSLETNGIASVLLSRALPGGQVAVATFLVDRFCLGVKDAWAEVLDRVSYEDKYTRTMTGDNAARTVPPAEALKLVTESVEYARSNGLSPHPDYPRTLRIFGDTSPADSSATFEFGKDGKPFFVAGPYDTPERCRQVIAILENHCGSGGYHYAIPSGPVPRGEFPDEFIEGGGSRLGWGPDDDMDFDDEE
jgi:hypothetical protein